MLDYDRLDLHRFYAGADVYVDGAFHRVADPFRHLGDALVSLTNPVGTVLDKIRIGILRTECLLKTPEQLLSETETSTLEFLQVAPSAIQVRFLL